MTDIWTKLCTELKYHTVSTLEWLNLHNLKIQDGGGRHIEFRKMSITLDWIRISAPFFMGICIEAMRRCPHFQKSKPEVNSRDVIKWTSEAQVRRSHWLERIFEPNLPQSTNTTLSARQNSQINITWKSIVNNSAPNLMRRCITTMRRWHVTKSRNRKLIHVTSLNELWVQHYKSLF